MKTEKIDLKIKKFVWIKVNSLDLRLTLIDFKLIEIKVNFFNFFYIFCQSKIDLNLIFSVFSSKINLKSF